MSMKHEHGSSLLRNNKTGGFGLWYRIVPDQVFPKLSWFGVQVRNGICYEFCCSAGKQMVPSIDLLKT